MLVALVRRSGHLVSKDDLLRTVWPDTIVEEVNLTVNISALRKALGRGRSGKEVMQTVPTRGYRFVVPVKPRDEAVALELQDPSRGLRMQLPDQEVRPPVWPVTENADAYRAYLKGRHDWNKRSEEGLKRAIESFQRAVYIDPRFAAAYSGLADSYAALGYLSYIAPGEAFGHANLHVLASGMSFHNIIRYRDFDGWLTESVALSGDLRAARRERWGGGTGRPSVVPGG